MSHRSDPKVKGTLTKSFYKACMGGLGVYEGYVRLTWEETTNLCFP